LFVPAKPKKVVSDVRNVWRAEGDIVIEEGRAYLLNIND